MLPFALCLATGHRQVRQGGNRMLTILLLLFALFGAVIGDIFFCILWLRAHGVWKQEQHWRRVADWRYVALKDAVETECEKEVLARMRLHIRWIENPPLPPPVAQQQKPGKSVP
jgi:hypothetical protein